MVYGKQFSHCTLPIIK